MKNVFAILLLLCALPLAAKEKGRPVRVSVEMYGYDRQWVYFDFVEYPDAYVEYPYKEGQLFEASADVDDITMVNINMWVNLCLQPGDSIHAKVTYDGRNYESVEYSGTPGAVLVANTLHKIRESRRNAHYRSNIPAALVTQTEPKAYHKTSMEEWEREKAILAEIKDEISPKMYNYLLSELDAIFLTNAILYPYAYAGYQNKPVGECLPEDFWTMLDGYRLRDDEGSLRNRGYMSFLLPYAEYMICKRNGGDPSAFKTSQSLESEYEEIAGYYDGVLRDAALFVVLYNELASEDVDYSTCERLSKDYLKNYNLNKEYKQILKDVMR